MDNLFTLAREGKRASSAPLAVRVRPLTLDDYRGQAQAVGPGTWLRSAIEADQLSSVILFGPAGTGKTTLARIIANTTRAEFVEVSAVTGTVKDLRREIEAAEQRLMLRDRRTILFVDEIHRFNRGQQDALLHAVEDRTLILVGATTENPYFEVNQALLSRSRVVELTALSNEDVRAILEHALEVPEGLDGRFTLEPAAAEAVCLLAGGDARAALTTLELASELAGRRAAAGGEPAGPVPITADDVHEAVPTRTQRYDKGGDEHYDVISAFIKSMRGSDPDAAVYYLARMLEGGEDPKFIARRIFILASEDVGNADPQALLVAEAAFKAVEVIGMPECRINLAQAAVYMALAPKSNASYMALAAAFDDVRHAPARAVPSYLRDRHRPGSEDYGAYRYPHNYPGHWVEQRYLPEGLERGCFYHPGDLGWEQYRSEYARRTVDGTLLVGHAAEAAGPAEAAGGGSE
jgi:putative ATPase